MFIIFAYNWSSQVSSRGGHAVIHPFEVQGDAHRFPQSLKSYVICMVPGTPVSALDEEKNVDFFDTAG